MTLIKKLKQLKNKEFQLSNGRFDIELYPCGCCGDPMLVLGISGQEVPIFNGDISTIKGIKAATAVMNAYMNHKDMTVTNFTDFLHMLLKQSTENFAEQE